MKQSAKVKLWQDLARSETRIWLIEELMKLDVGFNDTEEFGLGLKLNFKSKKYKENSDAPREVVMKLKLGDKKRGTSLSFSWQETKQEKN